MRAYHVAALTALLFWQIAPAPARDARPRGGPFRLALAYATGQWEDASFNCDGDFTGSDAVPAGSGGVKFEYLASDGAVRLTAVAGRWWMHNSSVTTTFSAAQVAFEGPRVGFGLGLVNHPFIDNSSRQTLPNAFLRLGKADGHFLVEANPPTETPATTGTVRAGIGFGTGLERRPSGFIGVAFGPFTERLQQAVAVADLGIPLSRNLDLLLRGGAGPGMGKPQWAAGAGLRAVW